MALIKCPECNHEVSDSAETCPNCGYRLKENKTDDAASVIKDELIRKAKIEIVAGVILFIIGLAILIAALCSSTPEIKISCSILGAAIIVFAICGSIYYNSKINKLK